MVKPVDALTALRVPLAVAFLLIESAPVRLVVVMVAAVSDVVDGIWARHRGSSRIGPVLDPVCDKLFVASAFAVVLRAGALSVPEVVGVLLRDLSAVLGFLTTALLHRPTTLPARAGGKLVTVGQILTLVAFLAGSELVRPLAWATAGISLYAIYDYTRVALHA